MKQNKASNCLRMSLPFLKLYAKFPPQMRKIYIKAICEEEVIYKALHELAHNTLNGKIKLNTKQAIQIKPFKNILKQLCLASNRKCPKKRRRLVQKGGAILPILLPAIASLLASIIS